MHDQLHARPLLLAGLEPGVHGHMVNFGDGTPVATSISGGSNPRGRHEYARPGDYQVVASAVDASGFHSELWSYQLRGGRIVPVRYGSGSDVQLWSTTDLAVSFARRNRR